MFYKHTHLHVTNNSRCARIYDQIHGEGNWHACMERLVGWGLFISPDEAYALRPVSLTNHAKVATFLRASILLNRSIPLF